MKNEYLVVGVMSGTSLDGIDLVAVKFSCKEEKWSFRIVCAETVSYTPEWKSKLSEAICLPDPQLALLNEEYTTLLAIETGRFIKNFKLEQVDAVCSHGHTVFHEPDKGKTFQIGNLPVLATLVQKKVVCNFRIDDVALGGQGAPLVPVGDRLLFSDYDYCLNLGGFANISFEKNLERLAYDVCPVNVVLNHYAQKLGKEFDESGAMAARGKINHMLLEKLNSIDFYAKNPPKSLGMEWVKEEIFPILEAVPQDPKDILHTFCHHIATQLTLQFQPGSTVLVTGGGAYNNFLISCIQEKFSGKLVIPESVLIEYKEAVIFGLLGVLRLRNEINVLASVTGASKNHSSGYIYLPES